MMAADRRDDDFFEVYTKDLTGEDVQRLFTRDAPDAYRFFTRHIDEAAFAELPPMQRVALRTRLLFLAFTLKLSPARRALFAVSLAAFVGGLLELFAGIDLVRVPVVHVSPRHSTAPPWSGRTAPAGSRSASSSSTCWCSWRWRTG